MKKISFFLIITSILFSGCGQEAKTKEYFEAHPDEAKAKYEECFSTQAGKGRMNSDKIFAIECANAEFVMKKIWEQEAEKARKDEELKVLNTFTNDIGVYYSTQAKLANKLSSMTNVKILNENGLSGSIGVDGVPCINVSIIKKESKPFIKIEKVDNPNKVCSRMLEIKDNKDFINKKEISLNDMSIAF